MLHTDKLFLFCYYEKFHRGPSGGNRYDSSYDLKYNGATQRPSNLVASNYYNPYLDKHGFYGANAQNTKDRISIGGGELCRLI